MIAKLVFEKFLDKGDKKMLLVSFQGIYKYNELPAEYLRRTKYFYRGNTSRSSLDTIFFHGREIEDRPFSNISQGDIIDADDANTLISFVKECGKDLTEIKRHQKNKNKNWTGTTEIEI